MSSHKSLCEWTENGTKSLDIIVTQKTQLNRNKCSFHYRWKGLWYWVFLRYFVLYYFSYIMEVSFIGGVNWNTQWKPLTGQIIDKLHITT